jgi:hypothetical protein
LCTGPSITGSGTISSSNSVYIATPNGTIGTDEFTPLAISSPGLSSSTVTLSAGRGGSATGDEGTVWATLSNRNALSLTGAYGFDVSSDTAFNTLSVTTRASGLGPVDLLAAGQSITFTREAVDLFGMAGNYFRVGSVTGTPLANATFGVSDGTLLVAGPTTIAATNLTLSGAVSLQGTALQPLSLTGHSNQTFTSPTSVLIKGNVTLQAVNSQTFNGGLGNITINADAGGGGGILISAPNQTFTTTGGSSKIEILGGAAANESVTVTSTNQQQVNSTSTSIDSFKLKGGSGSGASVTFSHSGSGVQDFNISSGTLTVEGGSGQNAFARIEETGTNQQKICRTTFFGCIPVSSLQILGGSGAGAYAQITANGSQSVGVSSSALIKAGSGDGAYALLQAGTSATQTIFGGGALTVEGQGGPGATAAAQILATGAQNITAGSITVTGGGSAGSLARIATTGSQSISASSLALNGTDADAVIEGHNQAITVSAGSIVLDGSGAGTTALRNLSGSQTINAGSGGVMLGNSGSGTVTLSSAGAQSITTRFVDVSTDIGSAGDSRVFAADNQRIHTTNGNFGPNGSLRVAALGTGTASIESGGSQLLEVDYPESMQGLGEPGSLIVGDANAAGTSSISAVDQSIIAGTVLIQSGGDNSLSQIKASNTQSITTLLGGMDILGGSGTNSLATIDPVIQTILVNGPITLLGGSGTNADASIVSGGAQTIMTTNGNILLTGGSGSGADAFISGGNPQQIFASGSIILMPTTGDAFISGPPTVFFFDTTSLILPLEEELEDTLSDTIPVETEDPLFGRELPICR